MKPLKIKSLLFDEPAHGPKYAVSVTRKNGEILQVADPRITRVALALMNMQASLGGAASHWGGPSAFAEMVSALYGLIFHIAREKKTPWHRLFHLINDAGHCENGIYALKANYRLGGKRGLSFDSLKGFRSIESPLTGHGESHLLPEAVYLSNGPLGSTLAQAQGLCMADCLQKVPRTTIVLMSDGACMEGESREALASIPGLAGRDQLNPFILIVSDNNTKLSGRIDEDSFSMDPSFQSLPALGWKMVELHSAHNIQSCLDIFDEVLSSSLNKKEPVFIRAKTIKGYGVKDTESVSHGGHGFPLKDPQKLPLFLQEIYGSSDLPEEFQQWVKELQQQHLSMQRSTKTSSAQKKIPGKVKVQEGISRALLQAGERGLPVVSVSADLQGSTGVGAFRKKFPECSFEVGVAEANMVSVASGFSKQGFIPIVDTFTQFGVTKGALPLFMANLSQAPVIAIFSHAGLQDAADGASHQSLTYFAQTGALPLTSVYSLSSSAEAFSLMTQAIESFVSARKKGALPRTHIFFLGREVFAPSYLPEDYPYQLGKAQVMELSHAFSPHAPRGVTLLANGSLLEEALLAGEELLKKAWKVRVINASIINHPDIESIVSCLEETAVKGKRYLLTIEDHHLEGGMGSLVSHQLALRGIALETKSLAVHSPFGRSAYQSAHLYAREELNAQAIVKALS